MTPANRERTLKIILVVLGLGVFVATGYPAVMGTVHPPRSTSAVMLDSILATMGVFFVLAARKPAAYRSLILFGAWSSFAHGTVMALMAIQVASQRTELVWSAAVGAVSGMLLLVFAPAASPTTS